MTNTPYSVRCALHRFTGVTVEESPYCVAVVRIEQTGAAGRAKALRIRRRLTRAGMKTRPASLTIGGKDTYRVVVDR